MTFLLELLGGINVLGVILLGIAGWAILGGAALVLLFA